MTRWLAGLLFLLGLTVGAVGAVLGPRLAAPYLPEALSGKVEVVGGDVVRKQREPNKLLMTIVTPRGAILATFTTRAPEIDMLVAEGDTLTLGLRRLEPFVNDPEIRSVKKQTTGEAGAPPRDVSPSR